MRNLEHCARQCYLIIDQCLVGGTRPMNMHCWDLYRLRTCATFHCFFD